MEYFIKISLIMPNYYKQTIDVFYYLNPQAFCIIATSTKKIQIQTKQKRQCIING